MNPHEIDAVMNTVEYGNWQMSKRQKMWKNKKALDLAILTLMLGARNSCIWMCRSGWNRSGFSGKYDHHCQKRRWADILYFSDEVKEVLIDYCSTERQSHSGQRSRKSIVPLYAVQKNQCRCNWKSGKNMHRSQSQTKKSHRISFVVPMERLSIDRLVIFVWSQMFLDMKI